MESTKENSCGDVKIVGSRAVKSERKNLIGFGKNMPMENRPMTRLEKN
jgi:hypothetical protein